MNNDAANNLKLVGKNNEDLQVISAYCQDSIVKVEDITFLKKNRTFMMMINRFMWEDLEKGAFRQNKRVRCVVKFDEVLEAKSKKINQRNKNRMLECLAIKCKEISNKNFEIKIFFSGDSIITLISECIEVVMHDLGKAWDVKYFPRHKI